MDLESTKARTKSLKSNPCGYPHDFHRIRYLFIVTTGKTMKYHSMLNCLDFDK